MSEDWLTTHIGDCREILPTLPERSVHMVCTSPPYWGLRDYGTASWDGGDPECDHQPRMGVSRTSSLDGGDPSGSPRDRPVAACKCGATRVDRQLGLEPTPEDYVANLVAVFREVRRVLRDDGTVWLNLGDSYASSPPGNTTVGVSGASTLHGVNGSSGRYRETLAAGHQTKRSTIVGGLKPKDLVGVPWRVAFALQADGWYLRSDIIWSKPNPMPESVTDRPTKSHEYVFLLSKAPRYYFDQEAVREPDTGTGGPRHGAGRRAGPSFSGAPHVYENGAGRNIRSVWAIATQPYPGAHFAVFPEALVEPCVKAGTSERGVCGECGAPWERVVRLDGVTTGRHAENAAIAAARGMTNASRGWRGGDVPVADHVTTGWRPTCAHDAPAVPATVLDPFGGSGTVARVANRLSRRAILIELNPEYGEQIAKRNAQAPLGLVG